MRITVKRLEAARQDLSQTLDFVSRRTAQLEQEAKALERQLDDWGNDLPFSPHQTRGAGEDQGEGSRL